MDLSGRRVIHIAHAEGIHRLCNLVRAYSLLSARDFETPHILDSARRARVRERDRSGYASIRVRAPGVGNCASSGGGVDGCIRAQLHFVRRHSPHALGRGAVALQKALARLSLSRLRRRPPTCKPQDSQWAFVGGALRHGRSVNVELPFHALDCVGASPRAARSCRIEHPSQRL